MDIIQRIKSYEPFNAQEAKDKERILHFLESGDNIFSRDNETAHITVSAWVVNSSMSKALMAYHNIYDSWAWLGGHADGDTDLLGVAMREVKEESGLENIKPVFEDIFSLEVLSVDGHVKKGKYVSSHLHLNLTFLIEADDSEALSSKPDENSAVSWFENEKALEASNEKWFKENIYPKLTEKTKLLKASSFNLI